VGSATLAQKYGKIKGVKGNLMMIHLTEDTHGELAEDSKKRICAR
jgi:hypothetical protein